MSVLTAGAISILRKFREFGVTEENISIQARSYIPLFRSKDEAIAASNELIKAGFAVEGQKTGSLKLTAAGASKVKIL
jgi:hypothetical protein